MATLALCPSVAPLGRIMSAQLCHSQTAEESPKRTEECLFCQRTPGGLGEIRSSHRNKIDMSAHLARLGLYMLKQGKTFVWF